MFKLDAGNVLLKPSQRRHLMAGLRRAIRLGDQLGDFCMTLCIQRIGRQLELRAEVQDSAGSFGCRSRGRDWRPVVRQLSWDLATRLHGQRLAMAQAN